VTTVGRRNDVVITEYLQQQIVDVASRFAGTEMTLASRYVGSGPLIRTATHALG
jgi:hypothetical protein